MIQKLDKWCDIIWIGFMCVTGVVTATIAAIFWDEMSLGAQASVFVACIMPFHVLEEWKFPGGFHYFYNILFGSMIPRDKRQLDRYPLSRLTDMITNIGLQWIPLLYIILDVYFDLSNSIALCMIFLAGMEMIAHNGCGILSYRWLKADGKRTIYHPGLGTTWMMFMPTAVYLAVHLENVTSRDWLMGFILFFILMFITVFLAETPLKNFVARQEPGVFAFVDAKYYKKYPNVSNH